MKNSFINTTLEDTMNSKESVTYFFSELSDDVISNIENIESISNNIVFAPAIGTLVTYFSDERPTPYLAENWTNQENKWIFNIRQNLFCEDGEPITAENYAKSLARTIKIYSQGSEHPIFKRLKGYKRLLQENLDSFDGIYSEGDRLIFDFEEQDYSGFLEHLTMAPFGYICTANFSGEKWKDDKAIISSGPFKVTQSKEQGVFELTARPFIDQFAPKYKKVFIRKGDIKDFRNAQGPRFIETPSPTTKDIAEFSYVRQMPQILYILALNFNRHEFADLERRKAFAARAYESLNNFAPPSISFSKAERFFANDNVQTSSTLKIPATSIKPNNENLSILMRNTAIHKTIGDFAESIAKEMGYSPSKTEYTGSKYRTWQDRKDFDVIVMGAEIGGGFEPWIIDMLFCSDIGFQWPDPSGRICKLSEAIAKGHLNVNDGANLLQQYISEDAGLIPIFHRGGYYLFSPEIDHKSLGPMVTRIRFEEIRPLQ